MQAGRWLRWARRRAGKTQAQLSDETRVGQDAISDIQRGGGGPPPRTLRILLRACGQDLTLEPAAGYGVDRGQLRALSTLTPAERARRAAAAANSLQRWHGVARPG